MNIKVTQDFRCFKKGDEFNVKPNTANYWVGKNGTGKSSIASWLLTFLRGKNRDMVPKSAWMAAQVKSEGIDVTGWEKFTSLTFFSDKLRQTQYVDMDALIDMGMGRMWASEGQNSQMDLRDFAPHMKDENHLAIFDEIDSHFDFPAKLVFFEAALRNFKGTSIVITHDPLFLRGREVFDFEDRKTKMGDDYYASHYKVLFPAPIIEKKAKKK